MKRVLVAPLNWGLGHATRCIPLIRELECLGAQVFLASDGVALHLLRAEFPHLTAFELPSYRIRYQTTNMIRNIGPQLPRILWAVRREQWETARLVLAHGIQGVLSDNRYGCFSRRAHCVLLSHQLHLRIPGIGLSWPANGVLRLALSKFDALWVPDVAEAPGLSGQLSHGAPVHPVTHYAGILTRMRAYECEPGYDVAVVLSGPEPQRSILEQRLLEQAISMPHKFIFVQGQTQAKKHYYAADNVEVVSYLTSRDLNDVLMASKVVVSRSGYSSVMDLAGLGKRPSLSRHRGKRNRNTWPTFWPGSSCSSLSGRMLSIWMPVSASSAAPPACAPAPIRPMHSNHCSGRGWTAWRPLRNKRHDARGRFTLIPYSWRVRYPG
ncbi:MAG: glycosyltransferase [Saprospirales bacterium]|nr:glycosyltransferase [Saprospirales bacterium]